MPVDAAFRELRALFTALDKDGSGTVDKKEWGKGVARNQLALAKYFGGAGVEALGRAFRSLDVDGSGDLCWEEIEVGARAAVATAAPPRPSKPPPERFSRQQAAAYVAAVHVDSICHPSAGSSASGTGKAWELPGAEAAVVPVGLAALEVKLVAAVGKLESVLKQRAGVTLLRALATWRTNTVALPTSVASTLSAC